MKIDRFNVELTTTCNLACQYCHQQKPDFKHQIMPESTVQKLLDFCEENQIRSIDFTGGGETTLYRGWENLCNILLSKNISLIMTSNFSREFSECEISTLSHFSEITVSLDTVDASLLEKIRGADLQTIILNMTRIRTLSLKEQRRSPRLIISVVLLAEVVDSLMELFAFAKISGVEIVNVQELVIFNDVENDFRNVWELSGKQATIAAEKIEKAFAFAESLGVVVRVQGDFYKRLDRLKRESQNRSLSTSNTVTNGLVKTFSEPPGEGQTRNCLDPWQFVQVLAGGQVRTCCFRPDNVGTLQEGGLLEILNGEKIRAIRAGLLSGKLDPHCRICHWREVINVDAYHAIVDRMKSDTTRNEQIKVLIDKINANDLKIVFYGAGQFATDLLTMSPFTGVKLAGVVDSDVSRQGEIFMGYEILSPASIRSLDADIVVIASGAFTEEIEDFLKTQDLGNVEIFKFS